LTSSRRCIAAGAWLLAAYLLVSAGGATAFADAGSDDTKDTDSSSAAKGYAASTGSGTEHGAATGGEVHSAHDNAAITLGLSQQPAPRSSTDHGDPVSKPATQIIRSATRTVGARQVSADAASTTESPSETDAAATNDDGAPASDPTPPTDAAPTGEVASPPTTNELQPSPTDTPPTDDLPPTSDASAAVTTDNALPVMPSNDAAASGSDQVPSTSDTASSDTTAASIAPNLLEQDTSLGVSSSSDTASIPDPAAPIPDVTSVLEEVLISTTDAVAPLTQLPADLAPLLGITVTEDQLVTDGVSTRNRSSVRGGPALSPMQILRLLTQTSGSSFAGKATEIPSLLDDTNQTRSDGAASAFGTTGALADTSSTSVAARFEPDAALPEGLQTFLHSYGQVIVAVSLSAMFAAALPGLVGLVIPVVAGMHIGYRQAKAGRALRTSGIAHLAASGPIGVVRSGSQVALRPPRSRVAPPNIGDGSQAVA
jgi:hypothetical protein